MSYAKSNQSSNLVHIFDKCLVSDTIQLFYPNVFSIYFSYDIGRSQAMPDFTKCVNESMLVDVLAMTDISHKLIMIRNGLSFYLSSHFTLILFDHYLVMSW